MQPIDVAIEAMSYLAAREGKAEAAPAPSPSQIAEAERMLGRRLPPSFLTFMLKAGGKIPNHWDLYWVGGPDIARRNIVIANDLEREHPTSPLPRFLVCFYEDQRGDQHCFDLRKRQRARMQQVPVPAVAAAGVAAPEDDDALREMAVKHFFNKDTYADNDKVALETVKTLEYPIVLWDREQGMEQLDDDLCEVADDFVSWLKDRVRDEL